jgi:hypothetical protein
VPPPVLVKLTFDAAAKSGYPAKLRDFTWHQMDQMGDLAAQKNDIESAKTCWTKAIALADQAGLGSPENAVDPATREQIGSVVRHAGQVILWQRQEIDAINVSTATDGEKRDRALLVLSAGVATATHAANVVQRLDGPDAPLVATIKSQLRSLEDMRKRILTYPGATQH